MSHISETDLALYLGGEVGFWTKRSIRLHLAECAECRQRHERFSSAREALRRASILPASYDWERISSEMTANIHLGLAAGECVASTGERGNGLAAGYGDLDGWQRPAVVMAGMMVAVFLAWFVYTQPEEIVASIAEAQADGVMLESTSSAIELNDNGRVFGLRHSSEQRVIGVSLQGAMQSRYVDSETGQVTINNVYVQ